MSTQPISKEDLEKKVKEVDARLAVAYATTSDAGRAVIDEAIRKFKAELEEILKKAEAM